MKLITAIVNKEDSRTVNAELVKAGFFATRLATTGGFLMAHNVTFLVGTENNRVDECIRIIAKHSSKRRELVPSGVSMELGDMMAMPVEVEVGGATVFVTDVERFEKL